MWGSFVYVIIRCCAGTLFSIVGFSVLNFWLTFEAECLMDSIVGWS